MKVLAEAAGPKHPSPPTRGKRPRGLSKNAGAFLDTRHLELGNTKTAIGRSTQNRNVKNTCLHVIFIIPNFDQKRAWIRGARTMEFEERGAWSAILSSVVAFFWWGRPIWNGTVTGAYYGADGLSLWAWDVICLIGGGAVLAFAIMILFNIAYGIATNQPKLQFVTDERDKRINNRGAVVSLVVISSGFLIAVGLLAMGWGVLAALNTLLIGMAIAGLGSETYRIAAYRLGL